jgi:hypothetical protein
MNDVTADEVYSSIEYRQYQLILDDEVAFYYAEAEIIEARRRRLEPPEPPPYEEWYRQYLQTVEWRQRADATKARFGRRCALCNAEGTLEAHHRTYERVGNELPDDLTALCADCHAGYHRWRTGQL